jgi:DNA-binding transcriptional MerR regulator
MEKASTETSRNAARSELTIGKLAERTRVTADSIRYYERERLIKPARKSESGYRLYTDEAIRRIEFIKHAQQCGFTLSEIRQLLELRSTDSACCDDIYKVSVEKRAQLKHKIRALQAMSDALSRVIDMCSHDRASLDECPILAALETGLTARSGPPTDAGAKAAKRVGESRRKAK